MRTECAAATVSTGTGADQPHPEEARKRRLDGRGVPPRLVYDSPTGTQAGSRDTSARFAVWRLAPFWYGCGKHSRTEGAMRCRSGICGHWLDWHAL